MNSGNQRLLRKIAKFTSTRFSIFVAIILESINCHYSGFIDLKCEKNSERVHMKKVKDSIKNAASCSSGDALKLFSQCLEIRLRSGYSPGGRASKTYLPGRRVNNLLLARQRK